MRQDKSSICGAGLFKYCKQDENSLKYAANNDAYLPDIHKPSCSGESSLAKLAINANKLISPYYTYHYVLSCDTNGVGDKYQVDNITVK